MIPLWRVLAVVGSLLLAASAAHSAPLTTKPNLSNVLNPCAVGVPWLGTTVGSPGACGTGPLGTAAYVATGTSGATIGLLNAANTWSAAQSFNSGDLVLKGATSGTLTLNAAAIAGTGTLTWPAGTTDFSATGGTSQVIKQTSFGGAFTVARLACSDLSDSSTGCSGAASATGANPSATLGLAAINGSAATFLRSDGAPALSQAIVPTWSGIHTFSAAPVFNALPTGTAVATANTVSTLVARDGSGNFAAGAITASLTGHASLDLALTGGTMSGAIAMGTNNITGAGNVAATTFNGNTFTTGTGVLTISAGKTATISNTLTFTGTDGSTLNIGTGGTLGAAAFLPASITISGTTCTLGSSCTPPAGAIAVGDTVTGGTNNGVFFNSAGTFGNTAAGTNGQLFLGVTSGNPLFATMSGGASITNAGVVTVLTNANLTGAVTSVGNATSLGSFTSANLLAALTDETGTGVAVFGTTPTITTPVINGLATGTGVATANTVSTLVARDGSGNFSAGTITASLTGTATNATNAAITDDTSTAATMNLTWATSNTGNLPLKTTSTKLTFIPSSGALSAASFNSSGSTASYLLSDRTSDATNQWLTYATGGTSFRLYNVNDATDWLTVTKASGTASFFGLIKPSIASTLTCGSGCSSVAGNPQKFVVTTGTAQTSVTANFGITWSAAPVCTISSNSTASVVDITSTSTTAITFGASVALTGALLNVLCF